MIDENEAYEIFCRFQSCLEKIKAIYVDMEMKDDNRLRVYEEITKSYSIIYNVKGNYWDMYAKNNDTSKPIIKYLYSFIDGNVVKRINSE